MVLEKVENGLNNMEWSWNTFYLIDSTKQLNATFFMNFLLD